MDIGIDTQGLEDLSQASNVPGFDPSQTTKDNDKSCDWWTPMSTVQKIKIEPMQENKAPPPTKWNKWQRKLELSDSPMPSDGRGELPSHGQTNKVWDIDVDRLDFPLQGRNRQYVEKFVVMILRIVKAVAPPENKKYLLLEKYYIVEVLLKVRLNKILCDCGAYALKHLECQLLGLDLSLVDDEIIQDCRQKIALDIWEAAQDPILIELMTQYVPSNFETYIIFDLVED
ncbi:unnamed protein product [Eruca vesicaria subsp. sativa]|uniref:Ubiquitin-like protease family profile domain-containing protein n=1 Tax=Eruca vesicaria subsp. sativa TaxID=29727 RepID=A0ABC8IZ52_ERUVS|nr:unnamed protein product [Eruca vesicaria subsp. sativa]